MKRTDKELEEIAKKRADVLICLLGLRDAKKIVRKMRRFLLVEDKRRKNI